MRTLRLICRHCMWFVCQYCQLYFLDKGNLALPCCWNQLSSSTRNLYMELEKEIAVNTNKAKPFYVVYLLPGEVYRLKQQWSLLVATHNTCFVISPLSKGHKHIDGAAIVSSWSNLCFYLTLPVNWDKMELNSTSKKPGPFLKYV